MTRYLTLTFKYAVGRECREGQFLTDSFQNASGRRSNFPTPIASRARSSRSARRLFTRASIPCTRRYSNSKSHNSPLTPPTDAVLHK